MPKKIRADTVGHFHDIFLVCSGGAQSTGWEVLIPQTKYFVWFLVCLPAPLLRYGEKGREVAEQGSPIKLVPGNPLSMVGERRVSSCCTAGHRSPSLLSGGLPMSDPWSALLLQAQRDPQRLLGECLTFLQKIQGPLTADVLAATIAAFNAQQRTRLPINVISRFFSFFKLLSKDFLALGEVNREWRRVMRAFCALSQPQQTLLYSPEERSVFRAVLQSTNSNRLDSLSNNDGQSPMVHAITTDNLLLANWLLYNGASLSELNRTGESLLVVACRNGSIKCSRWLLKVRAELLAPGPFRGCTPVLYAAMAGQLEVVKFLVNEYHCLLDVDRYGAGLLIYAAWYGRLPVVEYALSKGLLVTTQDSNGMNAALWACQKGQLEVLRALPNAIKACEAADSSGWTGLFWAAFNGHLPTVSWLLSQGASLEQRDHVGCSPVLAAALGGSVGTMDLFYRQVDVAQHVSTGGANVMIFAAARGHFDLVEWLSKQAPSLVWQRDKQGYSPLLWAAQEGHDRVSAFLASGASEEDRTHALSTALAKGHISTAQAIRGIGSSARSHNSLNSNSSTDTLDPKISSAPGAHTSPQLAISPLRMRTLPSTSFLARAMTSPGSGLSSPASNSAIAPPPSHAGASSSSSSSKNSNNKYLLRRGTNPMVSGEGNGITNNGSGSHSVDESSSNNNNPDAGPANLTPLPRMPSTTNYSDRWRIGRGKSVPVLL